ncbi:hypothetical protein BDB00DRAFT_872323 [Zychaea mexicana]|uniref:uncharacterized protein n=1 Tax=Zychaea mexicana TaxID=64656 RepID=UPI0022FE9440|nr:uncharacterized protein BDB00DRAFT_872323 [Zychaea mexicana]KAI9493434.1 hypothetical protein BDB00DRAFT_872323 [Zychaea mexicana]
MNEYTSGSDTDSGGDDDYAPIVASSWGDQKKPTDNSNDGNNAKQDKVNDWASLIDPNAKLGNNGVGSGDLHRRGPNYRPVDETLILRQRLQGASLKTEEEKKAHRERNARGKRKMMRYVRELEEDRPTSRRFVSNTRKSARSFSSSARGGKKPFSSPRSNFSSSARKKSFSPSDTTTTTTTTTAAGNTDDVAPPSPLPPIENKPLAVYRETAPWDDFTEVTKFPSSSSPEQQLKQPRPSKQPSSEQQQLQQEKQSQLKKKASVRFSHPLVQPPPIALHSPKSTKSTTTTTTTLRNCNSTSNVFHIDSTTTTATTTITATASSGASTTPTTDSNTVSPATTTKPTAPSSSSPVAACDPTAASNIVSPATTTPTASPSLPPVAARPPSIASSNSNPWVGKLLMEEPFWKGPMEKESTAKKKEDTKLIEETEPQQSLQRLDTSSGASKWSSGDVLTPSPVTTPTKRTVPPAWHPPPSADWVNEFMVSSTKSTTSKKATPSLGNEEAVGNPTATTNHPNPHTSAMKAGGGWQHPTSWNPPSSLTAPSTPVSHSDSYKCSQASGTTTLKTPSIPAKPVSPAASPTQPAKVAAPTPAAAPSTTNWQSFVSPVSEKPVTPPATTAENTSWQYTTSTTTSTPPVPAKPITPPGRQSPFSVLAPTSNWETNTTATTPVSNNDDSWKPATKSWDGSASSPWNDSSATQGWNSNTDTTWSSNNNGWGSDATRQQETEQPKREQKTAPSRFSRPGRPKYSTRSKGPTPANYRPDKPLSPPTKVAPPSRADNPVVVSINVELSADNKIPVHLHLYDDPLNVARQFAQAHSIHSPNIIEALNQLFSSQKAQAVRKRSQSNVNNTSSLPLPPRGYQQQHQHDHHRPHQQQYRGR